MTLSFNPEGYSNWLLDFDDTLVTGWATWGMDHAIPQLIREHNLFDDPLRLQQAVITAQQQAQTDHDPYSLLTDLFDTMGWSHDLIDTLVKTLQTQYSPALFEDGLAFLDELKARNCKIYAVTNNRQAVKIAQALKISDYFDLIITPVTSEACKAKPNPAMWTYLKTQVPGLNESNAIMLGDDPWSDGDFAQTCKLPCLIIDRQSRYSTIEYGQCITRLDEALVFTAPRSIFN